MPILAHDHDEGKNMMQRCYAQSKHDVDYN